MLYSELCKIYEELEKNPSRLKKTEILANFLKKIKKEKNKEIIYLIQGKAFPDYSEKEFGISEKLCIKALERISGISSEEIINKWKKIGDLGEVAFEIISKKKQNSLFSSKLTTEKVLENLKKLPELTGKGTIEKKILLISELLTSSSPLESKYIIRTLLNDLRIGIGFGTIRDAIVEACLEKNKENIEAVQASYDKSNDLAEIFEKACKGIKYLEEVELIPGKPLKVMLALKAESLEDGFERAGKPCAFEYKYDGFRMLISKDKDGKIKIFTRRLDEVTKQFPEVIEYVKNNIKAKTFIIDSEAVGYDSKSKKYLPFQAISQRIKRKYGIEKMLKELPVEIIVFDILYLNGKSLIKEPFKERTKILRKIINEKRYCIRTAEQIITSEKKEAEKFYEKALKEGQEGLMIKNLNSEYKPGARVGYMLKYKPQQKEFDLVITSAEYGTGKRAGFFSSFTLSCYDSKNKKLVEVGKASTGLKEKKEEGLSFQEVSEKLKHLIISESGREVKVKPEIIVTVVYQNIQVSPNYESGFALRFPRIQRLRPDKGLNDIATLEEIKSEFKRMELKTGY